MGHRGRDRKVVGFTTTYSISAYHHWCCEFKSRGTLGSVASLLAATLHQGNRDRNHKLWIIVSTERYILHAYHHWCCEFKSRSGQGIQHYVIKFVSDLRLFTRGLYDSICNHDLGNLVRLSTVNIMYHFPPPYSSSFNLSIDFFADIVISVSSIVIKS
jgi:hypothetical protein